MKGGNKSYALRAVAGSAVIVFASLGSSLAANIGIGTTSGTVEFGQGEFTLKACDSWIQLNLISGSTGQNGAPSGFSALTGITIVGLDASQCKSTKFSIQAFDQSVNLLPIYRTDGKSKLCLEISCQIGKSAESDLLVQVSSSGVIALSPTDKYRTMTFDSTLGVYKILFTNPAQLALDIANLTIQSSAL